MVSHVWESSKHRGYGLSQTRERVPKMVPGFPRFEEPSLALQEAFPKKRNASDAKWAAITPETINPNLENDLIDCFSFI